MTQLSAAPSCEYRRLCNLSTDRGAFGGIPSFAYRPVQGNREYLPCNTIGMEVDDKK